MFTRTHTAYRSGRSTRSALTALVCATLLVCAACARPAASGAQPTDSAASVSTSSAGAASVPGSTTAAGTGLTPTTVGSTGAVGGASTPLPQCRADKLATRTAGILTIAAPKPAPKPWFSADDPATGQGFEAAVAYAVAERLGYPATAVRWVRADRAQVLTGSASGFDVAVQELTTPAKPGAPIDYSTGYFSVNDAVVVNQPTMKAKASSLAGLKSLRLGVTTGTTAQTGLTSASATAAVQNYPSKSALLAALRAHQIEAAVLDTPTAWAATDLIVAGLLPAGQWQPDQLGMALPKGSKLTSCISTAIDTLRAEGKLAGLAQRWLPLTVLR